MKQLFLILFSMTVWAQNPAVFRTNTRVVEITIVATGQGNKPVKDLTANDVSLFDNRKLQTIASFEKLSSDSRGSEGSSAPPPRRIRPQAPWIVFLDALNTTWAAQIYGREAVGRAIETFGPHNRIALFALGDELRILHDFSSDLASLRAALVGYHGEHPLGGVQDQAGTVDPLSARFSGDDIANRKGRKSDPGVAFYQERRIATTLDALTEIARLMKHLPGRKNLLWVSAAFPLKSSHEDVAKAMRELTAAGVVVYAVDPRGVLISSAAEANDDAMKEFTEPTGGKTFYNNNDVTSLVRSAIADPIEEYLLTYVPSDYREDGAYHEVHLKTSRKGVGLRYRTGYFADPAAVKGAKRNPSQRP